MRDEFLNGELFGNLYEAEVLARRWKDYYNTVRPHGSLGGRPPAPQSILLTAGKTQPASPFKGGEPAVHHERAARALERLGILCYGVAKPMKECGCQEAVFTNSLVGTKTGGRPEAFMNSTTSFPVRPNYVRQYELN